jgi:LacI family transcriptional regulator
VQDAAKSLNYQPNLSARKLATGKSGIAGLVLPGVPEAEVNSLFVQIVGGMSRYFSARGRLFVLHIAPEGEDIIGVYERLINARALDGFVLLDPMTDDPRIVHLRRRRIPFVLHGRHEPEPDYPYYDIDNEAVAHRLTAHLLDRGHRRIAFLNAPDGRSYAAARTRGYRQALSGHGVHPDPAHHRGAEMTEAFGLLETVRMWTGGHPPPTAIICGNLLIAKGVFQALAALGQSVPRDVSVVAHDDGLPGLRAESFPAPLTVTQSPLNQSWEPLADLLARAIDGEPVRSLQVMGPLTWVERASVAAPLPSPSA